MSEANANEPKAPARRALLVEGEGAAAGALRENLAASGFEVERADAPDAARRVEELSPSVVLIAFGGRDSAGRLLTLARSLRSKPAAFSLPLVFVFGEDERTLRSAALHIGADDYFARDAPREEVRARLEALLWRVEAGRRAAPAAADQRSEIDNFIFLLDAVGADAGRGMKGVVALVEAAGEGGAADAAGGARALAAAHGFFKLNLRRVDAVAFYGPATLLVYVPGADSASARSTLARLRDEFAATNRSGDLRIGLSSFPEQGAEVERLVEQAEAALEGARAANSAGGVFVYGALDARADSPAGEKRHAASVDGRPRTGDAAGKPHARVESGVVTPEGAPSQQDAGKAGRASAAHSGQAAGQGAAANVGARRTGGKLRRLMLVVSDAARMAQVNLLMRSAGYEVRAAFDGQHALNLLRIDRPDLLVVDYELRDMDGVEMLRRLAKQSGAGLAPPAVVLIPAGLEGLRREAADAGASASVSVPYDPVELLDTLREFVETE